MKKLFGVCLDKNSDDKLSEEEFLVKEYDDEKLMESLEEITKRYDRTASKANLLSMVKVLIISVITMAAMLISYKIIEPMTEGENATVVPLIIPMAFAVIGVIVIMLNKRKLNTYASSEEGIRLTLEKNAEIKKLYASVGLPADAVTVDILDYSYETDKNGEEKFGGYVATVPMWVYAQDKKLFFSDEYSLYAFPMDSFKEIRYTERKFTTYECSWNKPVSPASEEFTSYRLSLSGGIITHQEYLAVILEIDDEKYELRLPVYEASAIANLTGLFPKR